MKVYELLKDLGDLIAGARAKYDPATDRYHFLRPNGLVYQYPVQAVETNADWFRKIQPEQP